MSVCTARRRERWQRHLRWSGCGWGQARGRGAALLPGGGAAGGGKASHARQLHRLQVCVGRVACRPGAFLPPARSDEAETPRPAPSRAQPGRPHRALRAGQAGGHGLLQAAARPSFTCDRRRLVSGRAQRPGRSSASSLGDAAPGHPQQQRGGLADARGPAQQPAAGGPLQPPAAPPPPAQRAPTRRAPGAAASAGCFEGTRARCHRRCASQPA